MTNGKRFSMIKQIFQTGYDEDKYPKIKALERMRLVKASAFLGGSSPRSFALKAIGTRRRRHIHRYRNSTENVELSARS